MACNMFAQGEQFKFSIYLDQTYGEGASDTLLLASNQIIKYSDQELIDMIDKYKVLLNELK